jgi:cyanophycinase
MRIPPAKMALVLLTLTTVLTAIQPAPAGAVETTGFGYRSWLHGNPANVVVPTTPGMMLEGGRSDLRPAWAWFLQQAGYGDIVIICATCDGAYNPYIEAIHPVDSVQTLKITKRRAAYDPVVVNAVAGADGIFFAGGDQSDYVRIWKDTPVQSAVNTVIARGNPVGGISAGLAILGEFVFAAEKNTITSDRALLDCFNLKITLERRMVDLPALTSMITDSHFTQRARMGRLLTFMARTIRDGWSSDTRGIGVDEDTAALVGADGTATVIGRHDVSFVRVRAADVTTCEPAQPLTTRYVDVSVVHPGSTFDLTSWSGGGSPTQVRALDGALVWAP